ncbi:MAG TPA: M12 family metallo-peptidase [Thermoanaerobaculia bacterium]|nr:M12 family metallo-peptidase [Thermoanaerobaculia bacterium]
MIKVLRARRAAIPILGMVFSLSCAAAALAVPDLPRFESAALSQAVAATLSGGGLLLDGVEVAGTGETTAFVLERFDVLTSDAVIIVHGEDGEIRLPAPKNAYFRGGVDGEPGSRVVLSVLEDGSVEGIVTRDSGLYLIGGDGEEAEKALGGPLLMHEVDPISVKTANGGFTCGNDKLPRITDPLAALGAPEPDAPSAVLEKAASYNARVAIETDFEYYQKFNNVTNATNYAINLLAYASTIYEAEVNTALTVPSVSLWTTSSDPWSQSSTTCGLMEFGRYWNKNNAGVSRTIAHFLSGRALGGGIAWLGVLCSGGFSANATCPGLATDAPWGGGYGFTASLSGTFNIANPAVIWDIVAVSHEIGHNFNSPHTHCYNGIGDSQAVDGCYNGECANGCYCGTQGLPGPQGVRSGTLMSYCHLLGGGFTNIAMTFGTGHPYGVLPGRVPSRMSSHVVSRATSNPSCLAYTAGIFSDGFETGSAGSWQ